MRLFLSCFTGCCILFQISPVSGAAPPNDNFDNRITITGMFVSVTGSNVDATQEPGEPFHWRATGGRSVWWTWTSPVTGPVRITTAGSSYDTLLAVYTGVSVSTLTLVANNDDSGSLQSAVTFEAVAKTEYQIAVDGYSGNYGNIVLNILVGAATAEPVVLTPAGAIWRYLDNGSDQGTAWRAREFNDSGWASGPAELGYGDASDGRPEATVVSFGPNSQNKYTTTYFRHSFDVTNPAVFASLTVSLLRDDGAAVYLNGTEIVRDNLPAGALYNTFAGPLIIGGAQETIYYTFPASAAALVSGTNVLAVEIHQADLTSSDISFDLELQGQPVGNQPPIVTLSSPTNHTRYAVPADIRITATASDADGTITNLAIYRDGLLLAQSTNNPFELVWTNAPPGTYTFYAIATDDQGLGTASDTALIVVNELVSGEISLVATGSVWRYLDDGSNQGTAWIQPGFNDSGWSSGPAELGYGDAAEGRPEATTVNFGPDPNAKYPTTYFRTPFQATSLDTITNLVLRLLRDDGAAVYLNGQEILRDGLAPAAQSTDYATNVVEGAAETAYVLWQAGPTNLVAGTNVLAVEVHQADGASPDLSFDLGLTAQTLAPLNQPPLVQLIYPANGATFTAPTNLYLAASAIDFEGVASVEFFVDGAKQGEDATSPYGVPWSNVVPKTYALWAVATDTLGSRSTSSVATITVTPPPTNTVPPRVFAVWPQPGTVSDLTGIGVTFSEPVTGVNAADLLINGVPASQLYIDLTNFYFYFTEPAYGTVAITWATNAGIMDTGIPPLAFDPSAPGNTWNYLLADTVPPVILSEDPPRDSAVIGLTQIRINFSEPVTGVNVSDLLINNLPASSVTGSGSSYTFSFTAPPPGPVTVSWANNHGITDLANPPNPFDATTQIWQYSVDTRIQLVATNAVYRFFRGTNEASSPMTAWRQPGFDDSAWEEAPAPFYYDVDGTPVPYIGNTVLADMYQRYTTVYLRTRFVVNNPLQISNLVLRGVVDDGFVAWINGTNVARLNAPGENLPYNITLSSSVSEPLRLQTFDLASYRSALVPGTNVLAIHGLNQRTTSSDFLISLELLAGMNDPSTLPPFVRSVSPTPGELLAFSQLTVTFTEPVTGVDASDLLVNGVPATGLTGASNLYTFTFAQPAYGLVNITWAANHGIMDEDSPPKPFDGTAPGATFQYALLNPNAPTIVSQNPAANAAVSNLAQVEVTFSKNVTGVNAADLLVNGAPAAGLSGSGNTYRFTFPQPAYGTVSIGWAPDHGITDTEQPPNAFDSSRPGHTWRYTLLDLVPPRIAAQEPPANAYVTNLTRLTVSFSEPVRGVDPGDLLINGVPASGLTGTGAVYTFTFPQPNATLVTISWAPFHGITDLAAAPNLFDRIAPGASWTYTTPDNVPPTMASIDPPQGATVRQLNQILVSFTEPVTGVQAAGLLINGTGAQSVSGSGAGPYLFLFTPPPAGPVTVAWSATQAIRDFAANPFAGGAWTYQVDPNASFQNQVVINEIMYHPTSERTEEEYIELHNHSSAGINLSGWRLNRGVDYTFGDVVIPAHGYLVVAANTAAFAAKYPGIANVVGGWTGQLRNGGDRIRLVDLVGETINEVTYADEGDFAIRQAGPLDRGYRGWEWFAAHDGWATNTATAQFEGGKSLELINPDMPNNHGQNWAASGPLNGTPGTVNSVLSTNVAPFILEVSHFPAVPRSSEAVTISARIVDERTNGLTVRLFQRNHSTTSPPVFGVGTMFDDGAHNDGAPNDGTYAVTLPPQPNGTVIEFYVQASDSEGRTRTWPAPARQSDGSFAQTANAVYQVDDEAYAGSQPFFRLILTETARLELQNMLQNASASDAEMNASFITKEASGTKIRYLVGVRNRGAGTRGRFPHNYRLNIPSDQPWNAVSALNLNSQYTHSQLAGSAIAAKAGLVTEAHRVVQLRINGVNLASSDNPQYGSYIHQEARGQDYVDHHFPQDPNGNLYAGITGNHSANLTSLGTTNFMSYVQAGYLKQNNTSENDWRDLIELCEVLSNTPDADYANAVREIIDVDEWMTYFAVFTLTLSRETSLGTGVGDDYALYRGVIDPRFRVLGHDWDTILNEGDTHGGWTDSIFRMVPAIMRATNYNLNAVVLNRFMMHPQFVPLYFQQLKRICDTTFSPQELNPLLDQLLGGFVPQGTIDNMKAFAANRRAFVVGQLPLAFSINVPLGTLNGYWQTTIPNVTLNGQANAIDTRVVRVNGTAARWTAWQGRWTNTVTLQPGLNSVLVQTFDEHGTVLVSTNVTIWYDDGSVETVTGTLASNTVWLAANGPYYLSGNLIVAPGATLTIQPGTTVYLGDGADLTVANGGRLLAEGTPAAPIRFTRVPGSTTNWGGITLQGGADSPETRITYAHIEYNGDTAIHSAGGTVFFDHLSFGTTDHQYLSLDSSSFVVQDCVFPSGTSYFELVHGTGGIKSGGRGIFLRNFFGAALSTPGNYNDVIDFTGGNRPGPIVQFINNVFIGTGDDHLDLDSTDAWVEGNIFMHAHKNGSPDTASAVSGGADNADTSEVTIIGNIIYDCDQAAMAKQGDFFTLLNNTIVHQSHLGGSDTDGAVVCLADAGTVEGAGMYLEGNIVYDAEKLVRNQTASLVTYTNNFLPLAWSGPGGNNSNADPMLAHIPQLSETTGFTSWASAQVMWQWFSLRTGSPAAGAGPNGQDAGGVIPLGVSLSGEPISPTRQTSATLTVGVNRTGSGIPVAGWPNGSGYTLYRWRLDEGPWSAETLINTPVALNNLPSGPHRVDVTGQRDSGFYQDDPVFGQDAVITQSRLWTVDPGAPAVYLNEILASNDGALNHNGTTPDAIELYNPGGAAVSLAGMRLTDDELNPDKFIFPPAASIPGHGYLVVYANNPDGTPGYHVGFNLAQGGESLYLYDSVANGGALLDAVTFGLQLTDYSIGRLEDGTWALTQPTFGAANVAAALGDPHALKLNEWLALGWVKFPDDFIELYNPTPLPVALGGLFLTDNPLGWVDRHAIAPLSFIPAYGYIAFRADGNTNAGPDHLNFALSVEQGEIGLADSNRALIDMIVYGPQQLDISEGRSPNGANAFATFTTPTPGAGNPIVPSNAPPLRVPLLAVNTEWRYEASGADLGAAWRGAAYDDSGWPLGAAVLGYDNGNNPLVQSLTNTVLPLIGTNGASVITYYFRAHFLFTNTAAASSLLFSNLIDDGAIVYLNGVEVDRVNLPGGSVAFSTLASQNVENSAFSVYSRPVTNLLVGDNLLAVEVHQNSVNNGDVNFGMAVFAQIITNPPSPAGVLINEVLANNSGLREPDGSTPDWVELYNTSAGTVDLSDASLTDNTLTPRRWVFPAGVTISAGGYLRILCNPETPASTTNAARLNTGFGLKADGGAVYLFEALTNGGALRTSVNYGIQTPDLSIGRVPNGSTNWVLTLPTPLVGNLAASLGPAAALKINEWMADPVSGDDWFELYNPNQQPVALGGLYLTDDLNNRIKSRIPPLSFIGVSSNGYLRFWADGNTGAGADHVLFKLSVDGESLGISSAAGLLINAVNFPRQQTGVSEGRFPDGSSEIVRFPSTASSGESNYRLLTNVVINEVLTHTDPPLEDAIELRNLTPQPLNIGGWYLSDSRSLLKKYRIPTDTTLAANGYAVFYENQFNDTNLLGRLAFALSSANGDEVYLSAATNGTLTGYRTYARFGPAANGVSFGRYETSVGVEFVPLSARTFGVDDPGTLEQFRTGAGASNAPPKVGPIVISEIMYHPPDLGTNDNVRHEFIELHNTSSIPVPLFDPSVYRDNTGAVYADGNTNTWHLRGGVDFNFPSNTIIPPNDYLLVVSFDPLANAAAVADFRTHYSLRPDVALVGPYAGQLNNRTDDIELKQPDTPQADGDAPYVLVEHVEYQDSAPWPAAADGTGESLQRVDDLAFANDPVNWVSGPPTPGPQAQLLDTDRDGMPDAWENAYGLNPFDPADAALDPDSDGLTNLQEYLAGTDPRDRRSALRFESFAFNATGSDLVLSFTAIANQTYSLEAADAIPGGPWLAILNLDAAPTNRLIRWSVTLSPSPRFYRLRTPWVLGPGGELRFQSAQTLSAGQLRLLFNVPANQACALEFAGAITATQWTAVTNYPVANTNRSLQVDTPAQGNSGFYRLRKL